MRVIIHLEIRQQRNWVHQPQPVKASVLTIQMQITIEIGPADIATLFIFNPTAWRGPPASNTNFQPHKLSMSRCGSGHQYGKSKGFVKLEHQATFNVLDNCLSLFREIAASARLLWYKSETLPIRPLHYVGSYAGQR